MAYCARTWSAADEKAANANIGDCASQAKWEAFALTASVVLWKRVVLASRGNLVAVGDPLGMLHGAVNFRSKDPDINRMFWELALHIGPTGRTVEAIHIWSEQNALADRLSRLGTGEGIPAELDGVSRTEWPDMKFSFRAHD